MRVYGLYPKTWAEEYAGAYIVDVQWKNPDEVCRKCLEPSLRERIGPCTIEWERGSTIIPDIVETGGRGALIVTERVKRAFEEANLKGFIAWPVAVKEPKRVPKRPRIPMVPSPYPGPPLWDIYATSHVHVIPEGSNLKYKYRCPKCERDVYSVTGEAGQQNFFIDGTTWDGGDFMLSHEVIGLFATQRVVDVIRSHDFTNFGIIPNGEIV